MHSPTSVRQSKYWCYTINNPTATDVAPPDDMISYHVRGKEVGADGTPHYQGYVEFLNRQRLTAVKKLMPRAHLEQRRGTGLEASTYCKKDGDFIEFGVLALPTGVAGGQQQKRNWEAAFESAKLGDFDSIDKAILLPYYHAVKRVRQDYMVAPPNLSSVCGLWYVGPPNTGKSHSARADFPGFYDKPANKWFDGYQGEETVIIDDFDLNHKVLGHHLKRWADRYAFPAEMKGTTVQIRPKRIVITSNYTISEIFFEDRTLVAALERRFTVKRFDEEYVPFPEPYDSDLENC